jgi:predicted O-linked N-acetylglucosamine transferase (SPINDLY family)
MAADTLSAVGLPELIAESPEKYVAIAIDWAGDLERLAQLRKELRERMSASPLCDGRTFTRTLEETYRALWRRWCARADG